MEMVSNRSAELFIGDILSSFTDFLTEKQNLEVNWMVANPKLSYQSIYQIAAEGNLMFSDWKSIQICQNKAL